MVGIVYVSIRSIIKVMSMLVIDYFCGIRFLIVVVFLVVINIVVKNGILVKGSNFIEELFKLEIVIFDKIGIIIEGKLKV